MWMNTASIASAPVVAAASTTCDRAKISSSPSIVRGMPSSAVRSSAPKISAAIDAAAAAMAAAFTIPCAVSSSGSTSVATASATAATSPGDAHFGSTTPSMPCRVAAIATSSAYQGLSNALTRRNRCTREVAGLAPARKSPAI